MIKRPVEITETYTPGKNFGKTRTVTVERIPATQVLRYGEIDTDVTFRVFDRVDHLINRALESNDLPDQRVTYTPWPPGEPLEARPWDERFAARKERRQPAESRFEVR